jgi:1-acyl-sn-glycerol-3-phosphate acyltransferase
MQKFLIEDDLTWKWKLRVIINYILITIISFAFVIPLLILSVFGAKYKTRYYIVRAYVWTFLGTIKLICKIDHEVELLEKLPKGPAIILSNHQSFWDNIIMPHIFPMQSWVIKKELYNLPFFGLGLRLVEPIAIDRSDNLSVNQILNMGTEKLADGMWVVMFPEATRLKPGRSVKLKPAGVKLAQMNNVPIVLMVHNAGMFWPKGFWVRNPGTIKVKIGNIIHVKPEDDVRKITEQIGEWMNTEKDRLSGHLDNQG